MNKEKLYDVIIVGGSYAGLSAAMSLGRSLREVLIIDNGLPCNRQTPHSHNFLTQDGIAPQQIAILSKKQVSEYPTIQFIDATATHGTKTAGCFQVSCSDGNVYESKKLLFATGIRDLMPDIKGFAECWGISVIHCPYCHGYEYRKHKTGILANGPKAFHLAALVKNLTNNGLFIFTNGVPDFSEEQIQRLKDGGFTIITDTVKEVIYSNGAVQAVKLTGDNKVELDVLYASIPFGQSSAIPSALGCTMTDTGHISVNELQQTSVTGIYACGDNSTAFRSVANAVSSGSKAGAMINLELADEAI